MKFVFLPPLSKMPQFGMVQFSEKLLNVIPMSREINTFFL